MRRLTSTEVGAALVAVLLARTAINASTRIVYPFLPEIARGLGISLGAAGALFALRAVAGIASPLVPGLSESLGRRTVMVAGLVAAMLGCLLLAGAPNLVVAGVGFAAIGLAKPLFDIPMQAWFASRVPDRRRGRVLGFTELTWALSLLLAVPSGFLIARTTWRAPFILLAVLAAVGLLAVRRLIADDRPERRIRRPLRLTGSLAAVLAVTLLFRLASELLFIVYGLWLEEDFGLSVAAIGVFTLVVVGAELTGEGAVTAFADRLGLRRSILTGLLASIVAYASLGLVGSSLTGAVLGVVGWFLSFEFTIVALVPYLTQLGGEARERLLSLVAVCMLGAGGIAALIGPGLYAAGGIALCGLVAAACAGAATVVLVTRVRPPSPVGAA